MTRRLERANTAGRPYLISLSLGTALARAVDLTTLGLIAQADADLYVQSAAGKPSRTGARSVE